MNNTQDADFDTDFVEFDDTYDSHGNCSVGGMYDVGGHIISARYADFIDDMRDRIKDSQ